MFHLSSRLDGRLISILPHVSNLRDCPSHACSFWEDLSTCEHTKVVDSAIAFRVFFPGEMFSRLFRRWFDLDVAAKSTAKTKGSKGNIERILAALAASRVHVELMDKT